MSTRSDLVNAAAAVLSNPSTAAVESGAPPTETGLMGAVMPAGSHTEPAVESDDTRVTEEAVEGTEGELETAEPVAEAAPAPEAPKAEPAKTEPAKPKFDSKGYANQHAALTRRQRAVEAAERKVSELIAAKEAEFTERQARIAQLEKLDELNELDLVKLAAERRGKSPNDILRAALWQQAGYKPEGQPEDQQQVKQQPDPEILKMLKANEELAKAAQARADALEAKLTARERAEMEREDNEIISSVAQHALSFVNEERFPYLSVEDPAVVANEYLEVANEQARLGFMPTPEEILEHLDVIHEQALTSRYARLPDRLKKSTPAIEAPKASTPPAPPVSQGSETLQKHSSGPKAITNAMAAQTGPGVPSQRRRERDLVNDAGDFLKSKGF
jgi:hypothetical protein